MNLPEYGQLNTAVLGHLFDNMAESYKIFWFKAIVEHVMSDELEISFDALANSMIKQAWYMVSEYKLNLGPSDGVEKTVLYLSDLSGIKSSEKDSVILSFLETCEDKELRNLKTRLCDNVPYRLQAPFMPEIPRSLWNKNYEAAMYINLQNGLIYRFNDEVCAKGSSFEKKAIVVNPLWADYITRNIGIISGWIDYNMIMYLQRRNPSTPGIANKIYPPQERNLEKVKVYWKAIMTAVPVKNIYTGDIMTTKDVSIDHFVPWSYVAHDELWNLIPTTRSVNSSKSNNLPAWDVYFPRLADVEYQAYRLVEQYDHMKDLKRAVDSVMKNNLNDERIKVNLYSPGQDIVHFRNQLENIVYPAYESARKMGFGVWQYE